MTKKKGVLQKFSLVMSVVSIVLAFASGVILFLRYESLGFYHPISASLMASVFFFMSVAVILYIMGKTDIPSFKFDDPEEK